MSKSIALAALALALAVLSACGGGSDAAPGPAVSGNPDLYPYLANWRACGRTATGSEDRYLVLSPYRDPSMLIFLDNRFVFPTADCSGPATDIVTTSGNFRYAGSKEMDAASVDKFIINTDGAAPLKQVLRIVADGGPVELRFGRLDMPLDQDGFPTMFEPRGLVRQGDAIRKYLGTWSACIAEAGGSRSESLELTMVSDTSARLKWSVLHFQKVADCTGTGSGGTSEAGFLLDGTKAIGLETVDKVTLSFNAPTPPQKQVYLIRPDAPATLWRGAPEGPLDADGYPTTLSTAPLARR